MRPVHLCCAFDIKRRLPKIMPLHFIEIMTPEVTVGCFVTCSMNSRPISPQLVATIIKFSIESIILFCPDLQAVK